MQKINDKELISAINTRNLALVRASLDAGADLEAPDQHGCAGLPLRRACFLGHQEIVIELLQRGANPNAANSDGPGASMRMAQRGGHPTICTLLHQYSLFNQANKSVVHIDHHQIFQEASSGQSGINHSLHQTTQNPDTEHLEIEACYGLDTKLLLDDVARIGSAENVLKDVPANHSPKTGRFWHRIKK